ncbi:MAG: hypothetical protein GYB64_09920, partial [Chloroflexi bacterium]|nr:hypothetical protein [Chloroflexota bacterium]
MKKPIPIVIVALILLASVSCQQEAAPGGFTVADLFATPGKALATIELSPTPQPSPLSLIHI